MRYNSQCILVFSSTTIIPKKRAHARFCVIETVFFNYLFVTASFITFLFQDMIFENTFQNFVVLIYAVKTDFFRFMRSVFLLN